MELIMEEASGILAQQLFVQTATHQAHLPGLPQNSTEMHSFKKATEQVSPPETLEPRSCRQAFKHCDYIHHSCILRQSSQLKPSMLQHHLFPKVLLSKDCTIWTPQSPEIHCPFQRFAVDSRDLL